MTAYTLILLRHGRSDWNEKNLFTGWVDVDLIDKGRAEAVRGGEVIDEYHGEIGIKRTREARNFDGIK